MVNVVYGADATGSDYSSLPGGVQYAGYTTGFDGVPWTAAQWAAHPNAIRIDQSPVNTAFDETADVLDVEKGAATYADCPGWAKAAMANFRSAVRPGQRSPAIYCSQDAVTPAVNALIAGGVHSGIGFVVANWNLSKEAATAALASSGGPFPIVGYQYEDAGAYDLDVWLTSWVNDVSKKGSTMNPPPGQWNNPEAWTWKEVSVIGVGLDGNLHVFKLDLANGTWAEIE